ncbi:hypothetical protein [Aquiflexum balticum]|nr:hypothetical protein [Aquiflexum balticum]
MEDYWVTNREALRWRFTETAIKLPYAAYLGNQYVVSGKEKRGQ